MSISGYHITLLLFLIFQRLLHRNFSIFGNNFTDNSPSFFFLSFTTHLLVRRFTQIFFNFVGLSLYFWDLFLTPTVNSSSFDTFAIWSDSESISIDKQKNWIKNPSSRSPFHRHRTSGFIFLSVTPAILQICV